MKLLLPLIFLFQVSLAIGQDFEYEYFDQSASSNFRAVFFATEDVGYAASYLGTVIKSTDGGETWATTGLSIDEPISDIVFIDENIGFAVGGDAGCSPTPCDVPGSLIYKTTDGGATWTETKVDNKELYTVDFIDANVGFAAGLGNYFKTVDSGETWTLIPLDEFFNIRNIQFIGDTGYASCLFGKMIKSTDGGETWQVLNTGITGHLYSFDFIDENVGFAAGQNEFIKTTDGGETWEIITTAPSEIYSVASFSSDYIIASGRGIFTGGDFGYYKGGIYFSMDSGATWTAKDTLDITSIAYTHFYSENLGFAVGQGSEILKLSIDDLTNSTLDISNEQSQWVYPNPVATTLYVHDTKNRPGSRIAILSINGQPLLEKEISSAGLDLSELSSGIYIYQIQNDNKTVRGKLIKL